uniref:Uncharacterized protein n=1 Tax=viral metagenome TaxID=1070528 RepID=A0A6C0FDE7_9ZZZZ|tara:strand:- start:18623 stop:19033 length:411 start_codon:yes stop_codon:yes gene_type:complete
MDSQFGTLDNPSNNIHHNMPALMSDGRSVCSWQNQAIVDSRLQKSMSNWDYRRYLMKNAKSIMKQNSENELKSNLNYNMGSHQQGMDDNHPYTFKSTHDNTNVIPNTYSSDLKQLYLTRQQQQIRRSAPSIYAGNH